MLIKMSRLFMKYKALLGRHTLRETVKENQISKHAPVRDRGTLPNIAAPLYLVSVNKNGMKIVRGFFFFFCAVAARHG